MFGCEAGGGTGMKGADILSVMHNQATIQS